VTDTSTAASPPARTRLGGRGWLVLAAVAVVIVLASLKTFASIWTDQMWFSASGIGGVWTELFRVKVGLILIFGAIFFVLEKLAAVVGVSNLHVYAAMRGESLEAFQKTRNAAIQYGVGRQE